jgi:GGDEF domain-containing protein
MRYGGTEDVFVILFDCSTQVVETLANQILEEIQRTPWDTWAIELFVTCTIGMADLKRSSLIRDWPLRATLGMNEAKRVRGNRFVDGLDYLRRLRVAISWTTSWPF